MRLFHQGYGKGQPLIILHGLLGSSDNWHTLSRKFGENFRVFAVDLRNHGRSPQADVFNIDVMVEDTEEFMQQHNISSAHMLGHSMGGKVAMQLALSNPAMVKSLIVVDIAPRSYGPKHDHIFDAMLSLELKRFRSRKEIDEALAEKVPEPATRQFLMKNLARDSADGFTWKINLDGIHKNYNEINGEIASEKPFVKPALFIKGAKSTYVTNEDEPAIKRLFPNARVVTIFNAGHWVHAEAPDEFARIVLDFLKSL